MAAPLACGAVYPELSEHLLTPKADELVATPYRFGGGKDGAKPFFEDGLRRVVRRLASRADGLPVTIFYAFKQAEARRHGTGGIASTGWETMLEALLRPGSRSTGPGRCAPSSVTA